MEERADQVSRMEKIYSGAKQAVAWLGEGVEQRSISTDAAMDFLLVTISKSKGGIDSKIGNDISRRGEYYATLTGLFGSIDTRADGWKILGGLIFFVHERLVGTNLDTARGCLADRVVMNMGRKEICWICFEDISNVCTMYTLHTRQDTLRVSIGNVCTSVSHSY
jgi:hypothetical protein